MAIANCASVNNLVGVGFKLGPVDSHSRTSTQGYKRQLTTPRNWSQLCCLCVLFHPDYTVGPGITPDLLDLSQFEEMRERSRAFNFRQFTAGGELHPALRTLFNSHIG
jgi:hypothetical protein